MVQGHVMYLDEKDTLELATREIYEPIETQVLERYVIPGCLVLDLGANIGYYTLLAARLTGDSGRVLAFEPDPENHRLLLKNIEANRYRNVVPDPRAVSDVGGKARLFLNETNRGDHRLVDPGDGRKSVPIVTVDLDSVLKEVQVRRAFVKMDIQGSEWKAFCGMQSFLSRTPQVALVSEYWPEGLRQSGDDPRMLPDAMEKAGFSLFEIDEKNRSVQPTTVGELLRKMPDEHDVYTNLLGLKGLEPDPSWGSKAG